jgi:hypothetical protein
MTTPARPAVLAFCLLAACSGASTDEAGGQPVLVGGTLSEEQTFEVPAAEAWKAAEEALEGEEFKVERRHRDDCGGKFVARREDGHRVTVTIHAPEREAAEVAIYVEPADPDVVRAIQERLLEKLSLKKARADLFDETLIEASYEVDLEQALGAAERACRALSLEVTQRQREKSRARVEARDGDSRRVRFSVSRDEADPAETKVVFETERAPRGGEKEFLRRVRRELERHLFPPAD